MTRSDGVGRGLGRIPQLAECFLLFLSKISQKYSKFFSRDVTGSLMLKIRNRYRCHRDMCFPGMRVSRTHITIGMRVSPHTYH